MNLTGSSYSFTWRERGGGEREREREEREREIEINMGGMWVIVSCTLMSELVVALAVHFTIPPKPFQIIVQLSQCCHSDNKTLYQSTETISKVHYIQHPSIANDCIGLEPRLPSSINSLGMEPGDEAMIALGD